MMTTIMNSMEMKTIMQNKNRSKLRKQRRNQKVFIYIILLNVYLAIQPNQKDIDEIFVQFNSFFTKD
jgi:hypothetical protein